MYSQISYFVYMNIVRQLYGWEKEPAKLPGVPVCMCMYLHIMLCMHYKAKYLFQDSSTKHHDQCIVDCGMHVSNGLVGYCNNMLL